MTPPSRHLPAAERRAVTVEAVIALAGEQNPSEITTAAIADRMGLTQGAIFRHFPTKDAVMRAVMEWVAERLMARIDAVARTESSPLSVLERMFVANVDFLAAHPGIPRLLFGELQRGEESTSKRMAQTLLGHYRERLQCVIEKGKACGELDPDLDTVASVTSFIGAIQGLVMQSILAGDVKRIQHDAPGVFAIYRRGIRRR